MISLSQRNRPLAMILAFCLFLLLAAASPLSFGTATKISSYKQLHARDFNSVDRSLVVEPANITKRAITPEDFEAARARGCGRLNWLRTGTGGPPTQWNQYAQLAANGWDYIGQKGGYPDGANPTNLGTTPTDLFDAYNALGYSTAIKDNPSFIASNDPNGIYTMVLNPGDGAIVATYNYKPTASALSAQSDVYWLIWQNYVQSPPGVAAGLQLTNIKTFFRHHITNSNTEGVIDQVIENVLMRTGRAAIGPWPGVSVDATSVNSNGQPDSLQALVGTAHGTMPVYFLAQHRAALGAKTITSVNMFTTNGGADVNLAFNVGDV